MTVYMWCAAYTGLTQMLDFYAGNSYDEDDSSYGSSSTGSRSGTLQVTITSSNSLNNIVLFLQDSHHGLMVRTTLLVLNCVACSQSTW